MRQGQVGGLLAIEDPDDPNDPADPHGSFAYFYDGNGNLLGPEAHVKAMCT